MNMKKENVLGSEKIGKLLLRLAIPSIIAQLVTILYGIIDRIFIGQIPDSTVAMAGLSTTIPVVTMIMAFTQLIGIGGAPLCAIKLGQKDVDGAEKIMTNCFSTLVIVGVIISIILSVWSKPILYLFGATPQTIEISNSYIKIYALGSIFVQIALGMNTYINTQGFAKYGMITILIGSLLNIILDPVFIFVFTKVFSNFTCDFFSNSLVV